MKEARVKQIHLTCFQVSSVEDVSDNLNVSMLQLRWMCLLDPSSQVRRGPTSVTEFEVDLADMYVHMIRTSAE